MRTKLIIPVLIMTFHFAHAQQYGWVRVAQLGNEFTSLGAVEFVDSVHGWLYGSEIRYMYTLNGGSSWMQATSTGFAATAISMLDTATGWVAGNGFNEGGIGKTTDGGRTWIQQRRLLDRAYIGTRALSVQKNFTSGYVNSSPDTGKVVQTTNGGTTWSERTILDSLMDLRKTQFIDSLHGWVVGGSPLNGVYAVLRTVDGGVSWQTVRTVVGFQAVSFIDTLNGWSVRNSTPTYSYRTTDGGLTWLQRGRIEDPMWDDLHPSALSFVDSLNGWAFGFMFFQGDLAAVIFRTTDGGLSWNREFVGGGARHINDGIMLDRYHGWGVGDFGSVFSYRMVSSVPERLDRMPTVFALRQNYPNPFNPTTSIEYEIMQRSHVMITIYDVGGKEISQLVKADQEPGVYRVRFDAQGLSSGTYYCTMKANSFVDTKQMVFVK